MTLRPDPLRLSRRARRVEPFYVMELAKAAADMARLARPGDRPMIYLNIGEPDFTAPAPVQAAAERAIRDGSSQYTPATGLPALREAISGWYASRFGLDIDPARIVVTAGASAALQLACLALIEAGDEVLMPDPCYPCNRQFVQAAEGTPVLIPSGPEDRFQLSADHVASAWGEATRGVLLASPSNPTGTSIARAELERIARFVREKGGVTLIDEIYLGLSYDEAYGHSALGLPDGLGDEVISVNSFSKYFNMTGWRLGWLVLPPALVDGVGKLIEFNTSCTSVFTQRAGLAALAHAGEITPPLVAHLRQCRDALLARLAALPQVEVASPPGGMYAFFRLQGFDDSLTVAKRLVAEAGLGLAPGNAFGPEAQGWLRWCFASKDPSRLVEGVRRLKEWLEKQ